MYEYKDKELEMENIKMKCDQALLGVFFAI